MGKSSTSAFAHILQCFGVVEPADLSGRLRPGQPSCCTLTVELVVNSGYIKAQDLVGADLWKACVGMRRAGVAWHETLWRAIQLEQHLQHAIAFNAPALILKATNRARADRVDVIALAGTIDLARHACPIHGSPMRRASSAVCRAMTSKSASGIFSWAHMTSKSFCILEM